MQMRWNWKVLLGREVRPGQGGFFIPHQGLQELCSPVQSGAVFQPLCKEAVLGLHLIM